MKMLKIESNVPMPSRRKSSIYPFASMQVGDSFFVCDGRHPRSISTHMSTTAQRHRPKRFCTRQEGDGIRVWRIA